MNAHEHKCYSDKVEKKKFAWKTFFTHTPDKGKPETFLSLIHNLKKKFCPHKRAPEADVVEGITYFALSLSLSLLCLLLRNKYKEYF